MINFKDQDERPTSMVMVGSLLIILGSVAFMALAPKPAPALTEVQIRKQKNAAKIAIKTAQEQIDAATATIENSTWSGTPEEVLPLALQKVASMAQTHHLKVVGFHPQTVIVAPSITLIPCIVNVDGAFVNVVSFEKDIEAQGTNLVVNLMQMATADQESNKVTGSIGIVAYQPLKDTSKDSSSTAKPKVPKDSKQGGKTNA